MRVLAIAVVILFLFQGAGAGALDASADALGFLPPEAANGVGVGGPAGFRFPDEAIMRAALVEPGTPLLELSASHLKCDGNFCGRPSLPTSCGHDLRACGFDLIDSPDGRAMFNRLTADVKSHSLFTAERSVRPAIHPSEVAMPLRIAEVDVGPIGTVLHPPIEVIADEGPLGFILARDAFDRPIYRPGSGVFSGNGTLDDPYLIENLEIYGFGHAISLTNTRAHVVVSNNSLTLDETLDNVGAGVDLFYASNVLVRENTIVGFAAGVNALRGTLVEVGSNHIVARGVDVAIRVKDVDGFGIKGNLLETVDGVVVEVWDSRAGSIEDNDLVGARVFNLSGLDEVAVVGNRLASNVADPDAAAVIQSSRRVSFVENNLGAGLQGGEQVFFFTDLDDSQVSANTFSRTRLSVESSRNVNVSLNNLHDSTFVGHELVDSIFTMNAIRGVPLAVRITDSSRVHLSENDVDGVSFPFFVSRSTQVSVHDNLMRGCGVIGVGLEAGSSNTISENRIVDCKYGIALVETLDALVSGNEVEAAYGLTILAAFSVTVQANTFIGGEIGVLVDGGGDVTIDHDAYVSQRRSVIVIDTGGLTLSNTIVTNSPGIPNTYATGEWGAVTMLGVVHAQIVGNEFSQNYLPLVWQKGGGHEFRDNLFVANYWTVRGFWSTGDTFGAERFISNYFGLQMWWSEGTTVTDSDFVDNDVHLDLKYVDRGNLDANRFAGSLRGVWLYGDGHRLVGNAFDERGINMGFRWIPREISLNTLPSGPLVYLNNVTGTVDASGIAQLIVAQSHNVSIANASMRLVGQGVVVTHSQNVEVIEPDFVGVYVGAQVTLSENVSILRGTFSNMRYGAYAMSSSNTHVVGNHFSDSDSGVLVFWTGSSEISRNFFEGNALAIDFRHAGSIHDNEVTSNSDGIRMCGWRGACADATIHGNNLWGNVGFAYSGSSEPAHDNWWGCAGGPNTPGCDAAQAAPDALTPWLTEPNPMAGP